MQKIINEIEQKYLTLQCTFFNNFWFTFHKQKTTNKTLSIILYMLLDHSHIVSLDNDSHIFFSVLLYSLLSFHIKGNLGNKPIHLLFRQLTHLDFSQKLNTERSIHCGQKKQQHMEQPWSRRCLIHAMVSTQRCGKQANPVVRVNESLVVPLKLPCHRNEFLWDPDIKDFNWSVSKSGGNIEGIKVRQESLQEWITISPFTLNLNHPTIK